MKNETTENLVPSNFGISETMANDLYQGLPQIILERDAYEMQYNEIIQMDIEQEETQKKARNLRLAIKLNRTQGFLVWHNKSKEVFLRGGQFVDAIKRKEVAINERMEENLLQIENYYDIQLAKKEEELKISRTKEIEPYVAFLPTGINLGTLDENGFAVVFEGAKKLYEADVEAKRLKQLQIEKEAEERKKIEIENKRLADELQKEKKAKELAQKELLAKQELERKIEAERVKELERIRKEQEKLAKAPLKKQLNAWVNSFELNTPPIENETTLNIQNKFSGFLKWAKEEIEKL